MQVEGTGEVVLAAASGWGYRGGANGTHIRLKIHKNESSSFYALKILVRKVVHEKGGSPKLTRKKGVSSKLWQIFYFY